MAAVCDVEHGVGVLVFKVQLYYDKRDNLLHEIYFTFIKKKITISTAISVKVYCPKYTENAESIAIYNIES